MKQVLEKFRENGFAIIPGSINEQTINRLADVLSKLNLSDAVKSKNESVYGVRNLLDISREIKRFSNSKTVRNIVENILDADAKVVRAICFDKTPDANWKVPWHQDLTISVEEKIETEGFSAWTIKAKIQHVQPPVEILEKMVALRFHLDDADETNGALKIIPKSHTNGRLSAAEIKKNTRGERNVGLPRQTRRLFNNAPVNFAFVVCRNES